MNLIDISMSYQEDMIIYPNNPPYFAKKVQSIKSGDGCNVTELLLGSHAGTHIDAPLHFIAEGMGIDQVPLERMNGKAKVIDAQGIQVITVDFLKSYKIEKDDIIIFKTDNSNRENVNKILREYVTLDYDSAHFLAHCGIKLVGIDYLTIERPRNLRVERKSVHKILLGSNILILEGLVLENIVEGDYTLLCLPLKLKDGDGCPVRAVLLESVI